MINPEDFAEAGSSDLQFSPLQQDPQPRSFNLTSFQDPVKPQINNNVKDWEIDAAIRQRSEFADSVVKSMQSASNLDPQDYANAEQMAKGLNISIDEVFKDKDLAVQLYREQQVRRSRIWDASPELAKLLEDNAFAIKAQRDIDRYSYMERTALAWEQGGLTVRRGELGLKQLNKTLTAAEQQELDQINERMAIMPAPAGEILPEAARMFGMQFEMAPETVGTGAVGAVIGAGIGFFGGGGVGAAPAAAKGYFIGSTAASAYKMYEIEAGNAYIDMIDQGIDPVQASEKSRTIGLFNAAIELALAPIAGSGFRRLVNNQFVRRVAGDEAASETAKFLLLGRGFKNPLAQGAFDYAKAVIAEPVEEGLQELVLEYGTKAAMLASRPEYRAAMRGMGNEEQQSNAAEAFANAFWGMVAGGLVQGGSGYFSVTRAVTERADIARSNGERLQEIINTAANTKAPASVTQQLVTRLTDKHGNGDLSISASDLLSVLDGMAAKASEGKAQPVSRADMLAALRSADADMGQQLDAIISSGGNGEVFVKTADFVSKYVERSTSEFYRELIKHIRVIQDDATVPLSMNEAKNLLAKIDELRKKEIEIIEKEETPFRDAANSVRKQLNDMFVTNTTMNEQERTAAVDLLWTMAVVNARRDKTLPALDFAGMPLQIAQVGKGMTNEEFMSIISKPETLKVFAGLTAETSDHNKWRKAIDILETFVPKEFFDMKDRIAAIDNELAVIDKKWRTLDGKSENFDSEEAEIFREQNALNREQKQLIEKSNEMARNFRVTAEQNELIRKATGWFVGSDLKWRFEISDEDMLPGMDYGVRLKSDGKKKVVDFYNLYAKFGLIGDAKLSDLIDHPELFAAYPDLRDIVVSVVNLPSNVAAQAPEGKIEFNENVSLSRSDFLSVLMHEIQHHIQAKEGFAYGSNVNEAGSFEEYWNTPGEIEAREVEGRRVYTKAERSQKSVLATQSSLGVLQASTPTPAGLEATAGYIVALNKIILKKDATFREVAHEIGHMVLEDATFRAKQNVQKFANGEKYSKEDIEIAADLLDWLGVTSGNAQTQLDNWDNLPVDIKTEMHERLAYSYERYLETHKAPTKRLEGLFQRMSAILRGFWRNLKDSPAAIYRKAFGKELPILSSPAARALDLKLSLAHEIERSDIISSLSEIGMTESEAMEAGLTKDEWDMLQKMKVASVDATIDYAVSKQMGNAAWYAKKFRAAQEKYQRFVSQIRAAIFGEERKKLESVSVYNLRNWTQTGNAIDDQGNLVKVADGKVSKLSAGEVREAHAKMVTGLKEEVKLSLARIKTLDATYDAAEIKKLNEYVRLAKAIIKIDTLPALVSASRIFTLAKNSFRESQKSIDQFREELFAGMVNTALRTVRRSPLYVFRNIRSLIKANEDGKLSTQEVEDIIVTLLTEGTELNGFRASARIVSSAARKAERDLRVAYARTAKDILDAFRIEFTLEAIEGTKAEQNKKIQERIEKLELKLATLKARHGEAQVKVKGTDSRNAKKIEAEMKSVQQEISKLREEWNRITTEVMEDSNKPKSRRTRKGSDIPGLPAEVARMIDELETLRSEYDNMVRANAVSPTVLDQGQVKVQGTSTRNPDDVQAEIKTLEQELAKARERQKRKKTGEVPKLPAEISKLNEKLVALRAEYDSLTKTSVVHAPMSTEIYNKILDVQIRLNAALAKVATGRLNKEMLKRIEADAVEQVEVNYPEFTGKLKASEVNAAVKEEVNRRVARYIMAKFLGGMTSDVGVAVAPYQKQNAERTGNAKSFVLALIMAQQKGNQEEDVARERAEARLNDEFGKATAKMHVNAGAKELITEAIKEESVTDAYSDYVAEDGLPIDYVREFFGYGSNDEMLMDLLTAPDIDDVALDNTDKRVDAMPELSDQKEIDRIVGDSLANDMRVDIIREEIKAIQGALQRMFEAGLSAEEKAKREAKRDAERAQMEILQKDRDALKLKMAGFKAVGDTNSADSVFEQIKSLNGKIANLAAKAASPLVTAAEIRESAEHLAKSRMNSRLVREVKPSLFLTASRRAAQDAVRAMKKASTAKDKAGAQKDDYLVAYLNAKLDELVNEMMWREAMKAERSRQKDKDFIATIFGDKHDIASDRDFSVVLAARAVAVIYGLRRGNMEDAVRAVEEVKNTDPALYAYLSQLVSVAMFEASDASFKSMQNRVVKATDEELANKQLPPIYEELTWEQYTKLMLNLRFIWAEAKRVREHEDLAKARVAKARKDGAMKTMLDRLLLVEKFKEKMSKLPIIGRWFAPKGSDRANDPGRFGSAIEEYLVKNLKMESFFLELDNDTHGFWTKTVWRPLSNANVDYTMRVAAYYEKYLAIIEPLKDRLNESREIKADELTDEDGSVHVFGKDGGRGLGELFWMLAFVGDYGSYRRMIVGEGWGSITDGVLDDSKWQAFFDRAKRDGIITDDMLDAIQAIGDLFEELRPEYKRTYMKAKRVPSEDVPFQEVVGVKKKYKGWYMPSIVNPAERQKKMDAQDMEGALKLLSEESTSNAAPFLPSNRGKDRNENYEKHAKKLRSDHLFIPQAFEQLLRFIHFYDPMEQAVSLLKDPDVAGLINQYSHGVVKNAIIPWLQDIAARSSSKSNGDIAALMTQVRTAIVGTQMFANIKVALENITGFFPAMLEVHPKHIMRAIKQININALDVKEQIGNKSKFMRLYHKEAMMEMAMEIARFIEKGGKLANVQEWMRKNSTFIVKQTQAFVSDVVWISKYNEMISKAGANVDANTELEAVEAADSVVRLTQNSFRIEDKTVFERGTEMTKFFFTYTGYFNMIRQLYARKVKTSLLNDSLGQATANAGFYFVAAYTLPSILSASLAYWLYDKLDDDDEEKRDEFISELVWAGQVRTIFGGFPPIGALAMQAIDEQAGKNYGRGAGENPIIGGFYRQFQSLVKLVSMPVSDRDWTGRDTRNLVDAISGTLGIPSIGRPIGYIQAVATDEEEPQGIVDFVRGLLTGAYQK